MQSLREMPDRLSAEIEAIQAERSGLLPLDLLTFDLRIMAFYPLVKQHPQFIERLKLISLELRKCVLRWAKDKPQRDDAVATLQGFRGELIDVLDRYG